MVSETLTEEVSQHETVAMNRGLEFEIVDETSEEQVERERNLLATSTEEETATESQARETPGSGFDGEQHRQQGAADDGEQAANSKTPRTYSQNEVSKMQAAWAKQVEEARQTAAQASEQLLRFNMDAAVEAMLKKQEAQLTATMTPEQAEQIVRSPHNAALVRQSIASQKMLAQSEAERTQSVEQQERQARFIVAQTLAREHNVRPDDFDLLASARTPQAMQSLARRLGGTGAAAMRDRVPPETPQTQLENGYNAGPAPESANRRLERIRAKPSWEWTEADLRYMKTGEVR